MIKPSKIKVLVVEDSSVARMHLVQILTSDPRIQVIGTAVNGLEAQFIKTRTPDVILMDIVMPEMDGFEATRSIMETQPVPIVICSGSANTRETATTFRLMEAGAVAIVEKPFGAQHKEFETNAARLLDTVKLMAEVKVVRRWPRKPAEKFNGGAPPVARPQRNISRIKMVGIGASTGGPPALQAVLTALPKDFSVPVLIVQHISPGFLPGLVEWLDQTTGFKVHIAAHGMQILAGHIYLAPDDFHMTVKAGGQIVLNKDEPESGLRPSVDQLFRSMAENCRASALGVLLTGMGKDGAAGLKAMRDQGATTIVQDKESSIIFGMPGEAIALGAASYILPLDKIAPALITIVNQTSMAGREGP